MRTLLASLALFGAATAAQASVLVNVDFNDGQWAGTGPTYSGAAATGTAGDLWNSITVHSPSGIALLDVAGAASGISFSLAADGGWVEGPQAWSGSDLMRDFVSAWTTPKAFSFSGVAAGTYDLYIYANGGKAGQATQATIGATTLSTISATGVTSFVEGDNYLKFTGVTPVAGVISGTYTFNSGLGSTEAAINGFQLVAIPEPSTYAAIAGALALGLVAWRRRR